MSTSRTFLAISIIASASTLPACSSSAGTAGSVPVRRVAVVRPARQDVVRKITLPANVLALEQATLLAQVPGYLREIKVDKGDPVHEGDVLAEIDAPELVQRVASLRAASEQAEAEAKAVAATAERSRADVEQAQAEQRKSAAALVLQVSELERAKGLRQDEANTVQDLEVATARHDEAVQVLLVAKARCDALAAAVREAEARIGVARAKVDVANAALREAEVRLAYATIRAPFDGVVTARFVDRGALIQMGTSSAQAAPIVTVARMDRVRVQFDVAETEVAAIAEKEPLSLEVDAYPGRPFTGRVVRWAHALDPATRTMLVEAEFANAKGELLPGMYARATLELERHEKALAIPAEAVVTVEKKRHVWVVAEGRARLVPIRTGIDEGPFLEVVDGLKGEETIAVGAHGLTEGMPVEPVPTAKAEG